MSEGTARKKRRAMWGRARAVQGGVRLLSLTDWMQVFRAPTLPVILLPVMAGFLAGGGELFSMLGASLFVWSVIAHHFTFGHNSLVDAVSGHDMEKSPDTRPLVAGRISTATARKVIFPGLVLVMGSGALLTLFGGGRASYSLVCLLLFSAFGHAYNGLSKFTGWSFLPISAAFACLPAYSYFAVSGVITPVLVILVGFTFLTMWFEVSWEGGLKDIQRSEKSLFHNFAALTWSGDRLEISLRGKLLAWALKLSGLGLITYGILWHVLAPGTALAWAVLGAIAVVATFNLTKDQSWDREQILAYIGVEEVASFSLALAMTAPFVGWAPVLLIVAFAFVWVPVLSLTVYETPPDERSAKLRGV